ncbi:peptidoglycan DD-metalloendopeptidase family protein [Paraneptunicella aestuarii]|uniref:peptidoglycan DD-metalloendopeptidase family protein n=1 Tax=Paraneptunicella aestuarii TaxID=2831148 RepID=UPI001E2A1ADE|nr:peptidoglycan DD-metalloendopeptidase family protein [Paraneptunicella aestuarii]
MLRAKYPFILLSFFLTVFLTACSSRQQPAPVVNLGAKSKINVIKKEAINSKYYIVKKGDTLYSIAFSAGKDFQEIAQLNNIEKPYSIYPGQRLSLITSKTRQENKSTDKNKSNSKNELNQTVDQGKKSAYGSPDKGDLESNKSPFPSTISKWKWPAKGKIIDKFSLAPEGNKGIDIAGKNGDPIYAAADGKVVYTGDALRGYGKLIIVKHSESYLSAYAHNDKFLVKEQEWVKAGQQIALKGNSGTDKTMLHFEIRYKGKSVDPLRYLPQKR